MRLYHSSIFFNILLIPFKILPGLASSYLKNLVLALTASSYYLRPNNNGILSVSPNLKTKKTMGGRSFMVAAPALSNNLPLSVRQAKDIDSLKRLVKTYLFSKAFL